MNNINYDIRPLWWCANEIVDENAILDQCPTREARAEQQREFDKLNRQNEAQKQNMSGSLELRLPRRLEQRRIEFNLPDQLFYYTASYDWVLLYQIPPITAQQNKTASGLLFKPEATQDLERSTASRGIIISAGLTALDVLSDHGFELGNIVRFIRLSPYRQEIAPIGDRDFELLCVKPGDICSNEDLFVLLQSGDLQYSQLPDPVEGNPNQIKHVIKHRDGRIFRGSVRPHDLGDY